MLKVVITRKKKRAVDATRLILIKINLYLIRY